MKPKKLITAVLLIFVAGSLGYMVIRENKPGAATTQEAAQQAKQDNQIVVYYFHGDVRCPTCHKLEQYARESLETNFADWLASGKIKWQPTNIDTAGNEHFVKDYELVTKSVVLSKVVDGQQVAWKNLDRIWDLVSEKEKYLAYIRDNVRVFASEEHR
jgi:hypothetical protein